MSIDDDVREAIRLQQVVIDHQGDAYVEACPGAGKTRTLVQRVERLPKASVPRKGIAVLSFTNTAVEEFKERCHAQGIIERLGFPNFIGTFDGFLNHFLVLPFGVPGCARRPVIVENWDHIEVTHGISGEQARPIKLSRFDAATGGIDLSSIRDNRIATVVRLNKTAYETVARRRRKALNDQGHLCPDDARLVVQRFLANKPQADAVGKALAARFSEVIVDEAQDCNSEDVIVLEWLKSHGIRLMVVCDPDQAIFEFRKGTNGAFRTFIQEFPMLRMNGNFRSSKNICAAAGTMRTRTAMDMAVGDYHDAPHPIVLIPYGKTAKSEIGTKFKMLAANVGITECIVLAHKRRLAEQASGAPPRPSGTGGKLARLARLTVAFNAPAISGRQREATLKAMIRLLMEIEEQGVDEIASLRPLAESPEMDRSYRRKAIEILAGLPTRHADIGVNGWADRARALVNTMVRLPDKKTIKQALPNGNNWHKELEVPPTSDVPCATVHEAKGRDYDAVCLVLEKESKDAVTAWRSRSSDTSEALRVLYVGVTRAKRMLVIAFPDNLLRQIEEVLVKNEVPYRKECITPVPCKG